ncbi:hypothetical protein FACS1894172_01510 [Spirochaetia bacterium]|nr:hypothetical protein FACS1894164_04670 [Spirochaetia bacterium]GHU29740.1 hypothetical protein FACS1894172_01510 [Spirochaetia bacterium]
MKNEIIETIANKLIAIEHEHDVTILYAVESGSRAWGFESTDSDYDVRFIYVHQKNWYLNILPKRDVIEYPITDEFDYSGWDLRKALFLMNKSNPVLFEWLKSQIIYYKDTYFYTIMEALSKEYFSPLSSIYHYLHMAKGNFGEFLQTDKVKVKKYFYVLRPVLACLWIESKNEPPPLPFETLLTQVDNKELLHRINELLMKKKSGVEMGMESKIEIINHFIEKNIKHLEENIHGFNPRNKPKQGLLEDGLVKIIEHSEKTNLLQNKDLYLPEQ